MLKYPKLKFNQREIDDFLAQILEIGTLIETDVKVEIVKDDSSDNRFLECAITVGADYIISREHHLLQIKKFDGIKIISPETFKQKNS